ncbi:GrdX family protein [Pelagibaculum spongiae]|uniref:GrdX protein n=1 Tax=Pelagibaculum spongiae TaxID=2080658 RepID=A0A2V1GXE1_9GAMM|nr:GrdX family protein [Pelagibaculum spongiae]PVZ71841.1 GrdX protein [Pelagibaculum spongiae]
MAVTIVTNNRLVIENWSSTYAIEEMDSYEAVFVKVRDLVHTGAKIMTHPMAGSVKPGESPFRSVVVNVVDGAAMDMESLSIIENALDRFHMLVGCARKRVFNEATLEDFRVIDNSLVSTGIKVLPKV